MSGCNCEQTFWLNEKETAKTENGFSKIKCLHKESSAQDCGESVWPVLAWFVTLPMKTADYQGRSTPQPGK